MIEQVTLDLLQLAMDIKQTEHKTAAANVASANIPGSGQLKVDFADLLAGLDGLAPTQQKALIGQIRNDWQAEQQSATTKISGEDVKLDEQTAQLLLASGKYRLLAEGLNRKLGLMSVAVSGGKR